MADRSRQQAAATQLPVNYDLPDILWAIRELQLDRPVQRLLEGLAHVGYHEPARLTQDDDAIDVADFDGQWILSASKRELAAVCGIKPKTIQRDLQWFAEHDDRFPPYVEISRSKEEAHTFFVDWSAVRAAVKLPPPGDRSPVDGQCPPGHFKMTRGHDPGTCPGDISRAPMVVLGSMVDGSFQNSNQSKPKTGARIAWGRELSDRDLADVASLAALFPRAIAAGVAQQTDRDWIAFVALARYAFRQSSKVKSKPALFTGILSGQIRSKWQRGSWQTRPTDGDTDWARRAVRQLAPATAVDVDVQAASLQVGHTVEYSTETDDERKQRLAGELLAFERNRQRGGER